MQKNAFTLTIATFVAGIFGFFLRWLQNMNGFDDAGLAIPGATISVTVTVYTILVLTSSSLKSAFISASSAAAAKPARLLLCPALL